LHDRDVEPPPELSSHFALDADELETLRVVQADRRVVTAHDARDDRVVAVALGQSDQLRQQALELFGHLETPHAIAAGICDWIHDHIAYVGGSSGETCSATDTFERREGVCRDFAHLAIAFCRAMSVPARYATFYSYQLQPPDFHACVEVFIDGWWLLLDATRLAPLNGLVRIATGRDAADVAVCTIFGNPELTYSAVSCECLDPGFIPVTGDSLARKQEAIALI